MAQPLIFYNNQVGACPVFVQNDIQPPGIVEQVKNNIQLHGGIVLDDPEAAIIIVIMDQTTIFGSQLRAKYGGDTGKAVVTQAWVGDSIQQGQILGPPDWGGHGICRHNVKTYFQSLSLQDQDDIDLKPPHSPIMVPDDQTAENITLLPAPQNTPPVDNSILEGNHRSEMEVRLTAIAEQPGVDGGASTGSNPEGVNKPVDSAHNLNQPSPSGASDSLGTIPTIKAHSSEGQIAAEELDTSDYSSSCSSGGNTCQSDERFRETPPGGQDNSSIDDPDIMSITGLKPKPPPRHNLRQGRGYRFIKTDRDYLVELLDWWALNQLAFSMAEIYAQAAIDMPWHSEGSIRNYTRSNPELFGKPPKLKEPSRRSKKASSEYRQNQEVPDGCSYDSDNSDNKESDDMEPSENSDAEENLDFDDMDDGSSFHDFPSDFEDSPVIDDPVDQDTSPVNYSGMDLSEEDDQPHGKGKGKGPGIRPSSDIFQAMVVKLSENLDAFFKQSNLQRRMKLWEAFAKSYPHHSANSYYEWHQKHHGELELAAMKHLSAAQPTRHGKSNGDDGQSLELAILKDRLPSSKAPTALTSRSFGMGSDAVIGIAPTTSKRATRDNESSTRPAKKARFSLPEAP